MQSKSKFLEKEATMTVALVEKNLNDIVTSRGKRGVRASDLTRQLEALCKMSIQFGPTVEIPVLMHLINSQFDQNRNIDDYMSPSVWRSCAASISRIANFLKNEPRLKLKLMDADDFLEMQMKMKEKETSKLKDKEVLIDPNTGEVEDEAQRAERLRVEAASKLSEEERFTIKAAGSMCAFMVRLEEQVRRRRRRRREVARHTILTLSIVALLRSTPYSAANPLRRPAPIQPYTMTGSGTRESCSRS